MNTLRNNYIIAFFACLIFLISACSSEPRSTTSETGPLVKYDSVGYYDKVRVQGIVDSVLDVFMNGRSMKPDSFRARLLQARHGVQLYKVTYTSTIPEKNNQTATTYGLIAIPDSILPGAPIVSYQHGTIFDRSWAPSNPDGSIELQFQLSQFASQGYIVIAADYFGNTVGTQEQNSYGTSASVAQSCVDMLRASKQILEQKNIVPGKLFLSGWSQGGAATNAFLHQLEREKIPVAGAVTAAGPADLLGFIQKTIHEPSPYVAPYFTAVVTNMLFAFENYYGFKGLAESYIQPQFLDSARKFYAFEMPFEKYAESVIFKKDKGEFRVRTNKEIFTQQFLDESKSATTKFWKLFDSLSVYRQLLVTPYRGFYSYRDEAVMGPIAKIMIDHQKSIGNKNIEGFDAGPNADHATVYLESIIYAKPWFDSLK